MEKVTMDQVAQYIMYVANKKGIVVNSVNFTNTMYLICYSLIKEGRLKSTNFYSFYYSGYLSTSYTWEHHLAGIDDYRVIYEGNYISELEDKYINILSNLSTDEFVLFGLIKDNSYLMNSIYSGKKLTIGYSELEKENFSREIPSDCEYKVDLTVSFKVPWYLNKKENFDKLQEAIISNIKEGNVSYTSVATR